MTEKLLSHSMIEIGNGHPLAGGIPPAPRTKSMDMWMKIGPLRPTQLFLHMGSGCSETVVGALYTTAGNAIEASNQFIPLEIRLSGGMTSYVCVVKPYEERTGVFASSAWKAIDLIEVRFVEVSGLEIALHLDRCLVP